MKRILLLCLWAGLACGASAAESITNAVRTFQADFTGDEPPQRLSVDFPFAVDLSHAKAVAFEFSCADLQAFTHFNVYFQSGEGWYAATFTPTCEGKTERLRIPLKNFVKEGVPAGWGKVRTLRFSAWNGAPCKCGVTFGKLRVIDRDEIEAEPPKVDAATRQREILARLGRMPTRANERRLAWCHSPWGLGPKYDWDSSIRFLKANGFTDIVANHAWGGCASYESKVLTRAADCAGMPDLLKVCLAACRKHGIRLHVWKVCWNTWWNRLPDDVRARYVAEGRLQTRTIGKSTQSWLCPSDPRNQAQEIGAMCELADLGVDGVHFDYIRYPGYDFCFCDGCRARFEKRIGRKVANWPTDLQTDKALTAQWVEFRAGNISAVVEAVARRVRARHPKTEISAAVMCNARQDRVTIGQDWGRWCREGWLDFICPMDYTESAAMFRGHVRRQKGLVAGVKLYPGIGLSCWQDDGNDAERFAGQLEALRGEGCAGFTVFNFDRRAEALFPLLRRGPLAEAK